MYDIKTIKVALKLLKKYDYKFIKVSRELGIKINTLRLWRKKELNNLPLVNNKRNKPSKWSNEHKKKLLDYYFNHGENLMIVFRKFGEPSYSTIKRWVRLDKRYKQKHFVKDDKKCYTTDEKKQIIIEATTRDNSLDKVANKYDVFKVSIYNWQNELVGEIMKPIKNINKYTLTKDELIEEIVKLKKEHRQLEMENKILKKANELLKKEIGADFNNLTNKDKTIIISALKENYKISKLFKILNIKKATYYYEFKRLNYDKYKNVRVYMKSIFNSNYN